MHAIFSLICSASIHLPDVYSTLRETVVCLRARVHKGDKVMATKKKKQKKG
jgi:hypothetical protein